jgi:excisionase family DNA binding protein
LDDYNFILSVYCEGNSFNTVRLSVDADTTFGDALLSAGGKDGAVMSPGMRFCVDQLLKGFSEGDFLSVMQVARRLQVSDRHVRHLLASEQLEGLKVGEVWRVPFAGYREYVLHIAQRLNVQRK